MITKKIYNKNLGITNGDVAMQRDEKILLKWKENLESQLANILAAASVLNFEYLEGKERHAYIYINAMLKTVNERMDELNGISYERASRISVEFMHQVQLQYGFEEYERLYAISEEKVRSEMASF